VSVDSITEPLTVSSD